MSRKKSERSAKRALKKLAKKKGISIDTVQYDIDKAIDIARKSSDQNVQEFWDSVPCRGKSPTTVETIAYLAEMGRKTIHS